MKILVLIIANLVTLLILLSSSIFIVSFNTVRLLIQGGSVSDYYYAILIGQDQIGGSILYGTEDFTVSSWTYYLSEHKGNKFATKFRNFINYMAYNIAKVLATDKRDIEAQKQHCKESYRKEKKELSDKFNV